MVLWRILPTRFVVCAVAWFQLYSVPRPQQVQESRHVLDVLIGVRWASGRAAELEWFAFGERRTFKDYRGST
jgi:hypothetical protein